MQRVLADAGYLDGVALVEGLLALHGVVDDAEAGGVVH
jgi:hypothetical protein